MWDEQAASAAWKLERSENAIVGGFYTGAMFGYEDCADGLAWDVTIGQGYGCQVGKDWI